MNKSIKAVCVVIALSAMHFPAAAYGECDMIGMLITGGQTLTDIDGLESPDPYDFDEPSDFWLWFKNHQIPSPRNTDGYTVIYYGSDTLPPAEAKVREWPAVGNHDRTHWEAHVDNQVFRADSQFTGDDNYAFNWAQRRIWDEDTLEHNAYLILAHTRKASGGNSDIDDPHPFIWDYPWDGGSEPQGENTDEIHTFSFEHNGTVGYKDTLTAMTERLWSSWYPGQTWSDVYPYKTKNQGNDELVDSEAYFHWIVCNIKLAGDVEEGMRRALIAMKEWNYYKNFVFSDGSRMYAYRGLRTDGIHPDGYHRLVYRVNETPPFFAVSSGKPGDGLLYDDTEEILDHEMVEFDIDHSWITYDHFDEPQHHGLPYYCDFDDSQNSTVNSSWYLNTDDDDNNQYGRIEVEGNDTNRYLRMSNAPTNSVLNEASIHVDLSNRVGKIVLEFSYLLTGSDANPDGVYFSDDGGENFTTEPVRVMGGPEGVWQDVELDVDAICDDTPGLDPSSTFVVKFVQDDNDPVDVNTIDIDNISIYAWEIYADGRPHFPNIQSAIDAGCTEIILMDLELPGQSFTGPGNKDIDYGGAPITIRSQSGDPTSCIIDCEQDGCGFNFNDNEDANSVLEGVTIMHASARGIFCYEASPTFRDCIIKQNSATGFGGGVYCSWDASPSFENCFLINNTATAGGGGIYCYMVSSPTFLNCTVRGNSATFDGGGVNCYFNSSPIFTSCHIDSNTAENGGGVCCTHSSHPEFADCHIDTNTAATDGGGVYCVSSSPYFGGCNINGNTAGTYGGGVQCEDNSSPTFTQCQIDSNSAGNYGGGLFCSSSSAAFDRCELNRNTAEIGGGGGVYCQGDPSPTFTQCNIGNNSAYSRGGGVDCNFLSSAIFTHCQIDSNSAGNYGGGVLFRNSASPSVTNCIIWANSAGDYGGGVVCNSASGAFEFCTLSDNVASGAEGNGGGVYCDGSTTIFNSVIIAFSEGSGIYFEDSPGCQVQYCDFFGNTGGDIAGDAPPINNSIFADPLFVDREGGDFHLSNSSPCICEANPVDYPYDDFYEDNLRPDPGWSIHPDIGADENPGPIIPFAMPALDGSGMIILLAVLLLAASLAIRRKRTQEQH